VDGVESSMPEINAMSMQEGQIMFKIII
jgi:hypothetical protein